MKLITYESLVERLVEDVPELSEEVLAELEWLGDGDWSYLIFGGVVNPFLVESLENNRNEPVVRRIFNFVECMASSDDERLQTIVSVSVCERLGGSSGLLQRAYPYMGPATRQLSDESEAGWNPSKHGGTPAM
jgi:hypothetical protein